MTARTTALFPARTPEPAGAMSPAAYAAFRAWHASAPGRALYDALAVHVAERVGPGPGLVLSVGEGEGALAARLARLLPAAEVVGLDVSAEAVRAAQRDHRAPNLRFVHAGVQDLAGLGPARAVVSVQAFHHFEDPRGALRAMHAALDPTGALLVVDLRRDADVGAYARRIDGYVAAGQWEKASLLRASVTAAHTARELQELARGLDGRLAVRRLALTPAAAATYARVDPASARAVAADLAGLMLEAHLVRGARRGSGARWPGGRARGGARPGATTPGGDVAVAGGVADLAALHGLTLRERDVAALAVQGLGSREIAFRLRIATPTVCTLLTRIYRKTGTSGRVNLVRRCLTPA